MNRLFGTCRSEVLSIKENYVLFLFLGVIKLLDWFIGEGMYVIVTERIEKFVDMVYFSQENEKITSQQAKGVITDVSFCF